MTSLQIDSVLHHKVSLSWTKPNTACRILYYTVSFNGIVLSGDVYVPGSQNTTTSNISISNLRPYTNYTFGVVAATNAGDGPRTDIRVATNESSKFTVEFIGIPLCMILIVAKFLQKFVFNVLKI